MDRYRFLCAPFDTLTRPPRRSSIVSIRNAIVDKRHQVVVVGGGPVGVALAISLGLRGIDCALVETRTEMHRIPKGQNLTARVAAKHGGASDRRDHRLRQSDERVLARAGWPRAGAAVLFHRQ